MSARSGATQRGGTRRQRLTAVLAIVATFSLAAGIPSVASTPPALFSDGFETSPTLVPPWTNTAGFFGSSDPQYVRSGSFGGRAVSTGAGKTYVSETLSTARSDLFVRVWFKVLSQSTKASVLRFRPSSGRLVNVAITPTDALALTDSFTGVTYVSAQGLAPKLVWHLLQVHLDLSGQVETWLDGRVVPQLTLPVALGVKPVAKVEVGESGSNRAYDIAFDDAGIDISYMGPSAPTGLQLFSPPSSSEVDLAWAPPPATDPAVTYEIFRSSPDDASPSLAGASAGQAFSDTGLSASTNYYYSVRAVDLSAHVSAFSAPSLLATTADPPSLPPSRPQGLTASPTFGKVDLSWTPSPPPDGVDSYVVFRAPDAQTTPDQIGTTSGTSFSDTSVQPETSYVYSVLARNAAGDSPLSDQVSAVTPPDPVIASAGDIACDPSDPNVGGADATNCQQQATAALLGRGYAAILPLGDLQYDCGGLGAFNQVFGPTWGQYLGSEKPVPGNHEYKNTAISTGTDCSSKRDAAGYFSYFGTSAGTIGQGWYSYDVGAWHIVALNAQCGYIGGCGLGSPEESWLQRDLAANASTPCTLAYWHQPRWADSLHVSNPLYDAFWQDLYSAGAELILNGHIHAYERFVPQTPGGASDPSYGLTQITSGTGGEGHAGIGTILPTSAVHDSSTFGILEIALHSNSYAWNFVPVAGGTFSDSGTAQCHDAPPA